MMDYYYEKMQKQREREVSDYWKHPHENSHKPLSRKQASRLVVRLAFAMIALSALIFLF